MRPERQESQTQYEAGIQWRIAGIGSVLGAVDTIAITARITATKKKNTTLEMELPTAFGFCIGASRFDAGSTTSIIVNRMGSPHSGQSPPAANSRNS
jgi:hypothetical protein